MGSWPAQITIRKRCWANTKAQFYTWRQEHCCMSTWMMSQLLPWQDPYLRWGCEKEVKGTEDQREVQSGQYPLLGFLFRKPLEEGSLHEDWKCPRLYDFLRRESEQPLTSELPPWLPSLQSHVHVKYWNSYLEMPWWPTWKALECGPRTNMGLYKVGPVWHSRCMDFSSKQHCHGPRGGGIAQR